MQLANDGTSPRSSGVLLAGPYDDARALAAWLHSIGGVNASRNTLDTYRFEAGRWRAFLELRHGPDPMRLALATEEDAQDYLRALQGDLVEGRQAYRLGAAEKRLPYFGRKLKPVSTRTCIARLMSLYAWLADKDNFPDVKRPYVERSPFHNLMRRELRQIQQTQVDRLFPAAALTAMLGSAQRACEAQPDCTVGRRRAERIRWILVLLFVLWLRREELATLRMSSFFQEHLKGHWTLKVMGKGNKARSMPLPALVVEALARYRRAMGLEALPHSDDPLPAVLPLDPRRRLAAAAHLSTDVIYDAVKTIARQAADELVAEHPLDAGSEGSDIAMTVRTLRMLSPHWFRHSGATAALYGGMKLQDVSKLLGHASTATTSSMYHHLDDETVRRNLEATFADVVRPDRRAPFGDLG